MTTNDTTTQQFSRDTLIAAMQSILDNPTLDNMQSQLEGLSEAEKLHLKKLIDMNVVVRGQRLDFILQQQQGSNQDDQQ
jgi:hypothetical protein